MATIGARLLGFFIRAYGADHGSAQIVGPLAHDCADTPRGGMNKDGFARLYGMAFEHQHMNGHAFEHHGSSGMVIDIVGEGDDCGCRHDTRFRIPVQEVPSVAKVNEKNKIEMKNENGK